MGRCEFSRDEISVMEAELNRTGVEMPQFRQLGGMLADQNGGNRNNIKRAIQNLVNAVNSKDLNRLADCLQSPELRLVEIRREYMKEYMMVLEMNVTRVSLSQAEVQGHVTRVNLLMCLEHVAEAVRCDDCSKLRTALMDKALNIAKMIRGENMELYMTHLLDPVEALDEGEVLKKDVIIDAIESANLLGGEREQLEQAMTSLNKSLRYGSSLDTWNSLQHPALRLSGLESAGRDLYHSELQYIQQETGADLTYEGVCLPVQFLTSVASVSVSALAGDTAAVWRLLSSPDLGLQDIDKEAGVRYSQEVVRVLSTRKGAKVLTHGELQLVVDKVNETRDKDYDRLDGVTAVNNVLVSGGSGLLSALLHPGLGLEGVKLSKVDEIRFIEELQLRLANKSVLEGEGVGLWYEDIVAGVHDVLEELREVETFVGVLRGVNSAVDAGDMIGVYNYLSNNRDRLGLVSSVKRDQAEDYLVMLQERKTRCVGVHSWVSVQLDSGRNVWVEVEGGRHAWIQPHNIRSSQQACVLSIEDIRAAIGVHNRQFLASLTLFQARARGYLVRKALYNRLSWYYSRVNDIVKIQALWRGKRDRRRLVKRLEEDIRKRKEMLRMRSLRDLARHEKEVVVIQRAWRGYKARQGWAEMLRGGGVNLDTVVSHLHLLDIRDQDFREELDLQSLRGELSKLIRQNEQLEADLDKMDVRIGLLVQNRISVQECLGSSSNKLLGSSLTLKHKDKKHNSFEAQDNVGTHRGLKALKKESHDKLVAYQNLFYLLQTNPNYLARLMFAMPQSKTNKFLESVILTLYNFGGNAREEYLLLQLFKTALIEEVSTRFERLNDVVAGNPLVVKLVISYNRTGRGGYGLKELLGPLIKQVLDDNKLKINTNPVEVYKSWINQLESESGQACGLPYDVTQEVALGYEEVQKRLQRSITDLKRMVTLFMTTIIKGQDKFPYGILYISKVLYSALKDKFPDSHDKDLLKVVGNLVYYRYVNPTIVAPERFDILDKKCDQNLNNDQRRNLGSIAKILQFAASKKGFGDESEHLMCLNPFIIECHDKFKHFFTKCISVLEPE